MLGVAFHTQFLLDTKPVPVVGYKRSKRHSDFAGSAAYGVCPSRNMKYFGYKLVLLTTLDGTPVAYELVAANTDERDAAAEVLSVIWNCVGPCEYLSSALSRLPSLWPRCLSGPGCLRARLLLSPRVKWLAASKKSFWRCDPT